MKDNIREKVEASSIRINSLLSRLRLLERDNVPGGLPAVQMRDISALCNAVEKAIPSLDLLQTRLEQGAKIEYQDEEWHLFEETGNGICRGKTVREMLMNLIFVDC